MCTGVHWSPLECSPVWSHFGAGRSRSSTGHPGRYGNTAVVRRKRDALGYVAPVCRGHDDRLVREPAQVRGASGYVPRRPEATTLYGVVQHHLETWLSNARVQERSVPRFVERELRAFLECGVLANGFLRLHCDACGLDRVVPFSCKGRGFCPSCRGRHMADTAAHLVDRVLPRVPVRQWVANQWTPNRSSRSSVTSWSRGTRS